MCTVQVSNGSVALCDMYEGLLQCSVRGHIIAAADTRVVRRDDYAESSCEGLLCSDFLIVRVPSRWFADLVF